MTKGGGFRRTFSRVGPWGATARELQGGWVEATRNCPDEAASDKAG